MTSVFHFWGELALIAFPLLLILAGAEDVMKRRIPNVLCVSLATIFLPFAVLSGMPYLFVALHILTGIVLLLLSYGLFRCGWFGGGDGKLLAAVGLWIGFPSVLPFMLFTAVAGGLLAVVIGLWFIASTEMRLRSAKLDRALAPLAPDLPYGFALAAGAILATPLTWWMAAATAQA